MTTAVTFHRAFDSDNHFNVSIDGKERAAMLSKCTDGRWHIQYGDPNSDQGRFVRGLNHAMTWVEQNTDRILNA